MSKLLAVDLDGTLLYPKPHRRLISKKNVCFLQRWVDQGNKIVIVSSRGYSFTKKLVDVIKRPIDSINCIGAQIRINNEIVKDEPIPNETLIHLMKQINESINPLAYIAVAEENEPLLLKDNHGLGPFLRNLYRFWYWCQGSLREDYVLDNERFDNHIENGKMYLVRILFGLKKNKAQIAKEFNKMLRKDYPEIESSWTDIIIELTPKGCSKAESIQFYCEKTGFDAKDVYVVGDSGNDITMFQNFFENSYCMKHAYPSVKKYAKHIISRVYKLDSLVLKGE